MRTPPTIRWQTIENSPWAGAYREELYWLAAGVASDCETIFQDAPAPPNDGSSYLKVDAELHRRIDSALNGSARIRALLSPRGKSRSQSQAAHDFQEARMSWLGQLVDLNTIPTLLSSKVRNTLEHFDEYLDQAAMKSASGKIGHPILVVNLIAVGSEGALTTIRPSSMTSSEVFPIRMYVSDVRRYENCGHPVDMNALHSESVGIREKIGPLLGETITEETRGSTMFFVGDKSFRND